MKKTLITLLTLITVFAMATGAFAEKDTDAKLKALEKRLQSLEQKSAKDRIQWTGDLRVEAHSITVKWIPISMACVFRPLLMGPCLCK